MNLANYFFFKSLSPNTNIDFKEYVKLLIKGLKKGIQDVQIKNPPSLQ